MATARPFAYNTGSTISGTIQVGSLSVGTPTSGFTDSPQYWNGADEDLGYVIAGSVPDNSQPSPVSGKTGSVQFWRSSALTENSFIITANYLTGQSFTGGTQASDYLTSNGYWNSWVDIPTIEYIGITYTGTNATNYTFNNVNNGGPGLIAVVIHCGNNVYYSDLSNQKIGGVAATQVTTNQNTKIIYRYISSTATTTSVSFTLSSPPDYGLAISVFRIRNNVSNTPYTTDTTGVNLAGQVIYNFGTIPEKACVLVGSTLTNAASPSSNTFTLATEKYDTGPSNQFKYSAGTYITTTTGNLQIRSTWNGGGSFGASIDGTGIIWL